MKYLKYLLIAVVGLFTAACAEEDPTSLGILNPKATVSNITATTAIITVDLSDCAELLQGKEWDCRVDFIKGGERFAESYREDNISGNPFIRIFSFDDFQPATTYSFAIEITSVLGSWQSIYCRRDDFTFTTAKEGDYSALTKPEPYEILISDNLCEIGFKSNFLMYLESIVISENSDLSHPICLLDSTVKTNHYKAGYTEYIITFRNLKPNTTYYWAVSGRFNTSMVPLSQEYRSEIFKFTTKSSTE